MHLHKHLKTDDFVWDRKVINSFLHAIAFLQIVFLFCHQIVFKNFVYNNSDQTFESCIHVKL